MFSSGSTVPLMASKRQTRRSVRDSQMRMPSAGARPVAMPMAATRTHCSTQRVV